MPGFKRCADKTTSRAVFISLDLEKMPWISYRAATSSYCRPPAKASRFQPLRRWPAAYPWSRRGAADLSYADKLGTADGVQKIRLKHKKWDTKARFKIGGVNTPLPAPFSATSLFDQDSEVTIQLQNDVGGCWSTRYRASDTILHDAGRFKAMDR